MGTNIDDIINAFDSLTGDESQRKKEDCCQSELFHRLILIGRDRIEDEIDQPVCLRLDRVETLSDEHGMIQHIT